MSEKCKSADVSVASKNDLYLENDLKVWTYRLGLDLIPGVKLNNDSVKPSEMKPITYRLIHRSN